MQSLLTCPEPFGKSCSKRHARFIPLHFQIGPPCLVDERDAVALLLSYETRHQGLIML